MNVLGQRDILTIWAVRLLSSCFPSPGKFSPSRIKEDPSASCFSYTKHVPLVSTLQLCHTKRVAPLIYTRATCKLM